MKRAKYEKELFEAYIGTPKKFDWYSKAFDYFEKRGEKLSWYWNNWAFLGGFWYFIYRKQMKMAMIVLFLSVLMGAIVPMHLLLPVFLMINILIGGFGSYFVYKNYVDKKGEIEGIISEKEKRIMLMQRQVGGINRWAIPTALFALVSFILIIAGLISIAGKSTGSCHNPNKPKQSLMQ